MTRDILIEPRDPAMFRDGRPFSAGLGAKSLGWPMPSTIAGHIRTRLWQPRSFAPAKFGENEKRELLGVRHLGPFLAHEGEERDRWALAFPAPADAAVYRSGVSSLRVVPLRPARDEQAGHGCDLPDGMHPLRGAAAGKVADDTPSFWTAEETLLWLKTLGTETWTRPDAQLGFPELPEQSRIHIEIKAHKRNAKESMLFRTVSREFDFDTEFHPDRRRKRPSRMSRRAAIYSRVEAADGRWNSTSGWGAIGGERRLATWGETTNLLPTAPDDPPPGGLLRMQLLTPAIFDEGWRPGWLANGAPPGCPGLKLELVSAAIPRYQAVSGFDMASSGKNRFRATRFVVPAGSVYFFRVTDGDARQLWLKSVSDNGQDQRDGFGIVLTGGWQWR